MKDILDRLFGVVIVLAVFFVLGGAIRVMEYFFGGGREDGRDSSGE